MFVIVTENDEQFKFDKWDDALAFRGEKRRNGERTWWRREEVKKKYKAHRPENELEHMIMAIGSMIPGGNINITGKKIKKRNNFEYPHIIETLVDAAIERR